MLTSTRWLIEAYQLGRDLLDAHGLSAWSFGFNRRKRALGLCRFEARRIELSAYFVARNERDQIRDTILHEVAHALVGSGHGHDATWRRKCIEIGAKPIRCGQADMPPGRWQAACGGCGRRFHRHRRPERMHGWYCRRCGPERGNLVWRSGDN